jgi:hypothetical protein
MVLIGIDPYPYLTNPWDFCCGIKGYSEKYEFISWDCSQYTKIENV